MGLTRNRSKIYLDMLRLEQPMLMCFYLIFKVRYIFFPELTQNLLYLGMEGQLLQPEHEKRLMQGFHNDGLFRSIRPKSRHQDLGLLGPNTISEHGTLHPHTIIHSGTLRRDHSSPVIRELFSQVGQDQVDHLALHAGLQALFGLGEEGLDVLH